jgi:hypothetical protein
MISSMNQLGLGARPRPKQKSAKGAGRTADPFLLAGLHDASPIHHDGGIT